MTTPELSVVIPCRNDAALLPNQLEALSSQTWTGTWELVFVDNGSIDGSAAVARSYLDRIPSLRIVDAHDAAGRQHACNVGARAAAGRSLVFLDSDDVVAPGYLAAMATALETRRFVAARIDYDTLNPPWLRASRRGAQAEGLQDWHFLPIAAGCSLGMRRDTFLELGGFDPGMAYGEDVDLCWRAHYAGVTLHFVPDAVVAYRFRDRPIAIYRQSRGYGRGAAVLYRIFDDPRVSTSRKAGGALGTVRRTVKRVPRLLDRTIAAQVAWDVGYLVGWLQSSVAPARYCQPSDLPRSAS